MKNKPFDRYERLENENAVLRTALMRIANMEEVDGAIGSEAIEIANTALKDANKTKTKT